MAKRAATPLLPVRPDLALDRWGNRKVLLDIRQPRHELLEFERNAFFNDLCGEIVKEEAILLAGAPGSNKSTLARQLGIDLAAQGHRVLFVLTENRPSGSRPRCCG